MSMSDLIQTLLNGNYPSYNGKCEICHRRKKVRDYRVVNGGHIVAKSEKLCNKCAGKLMENNFSITYLPVETLIDKLDSKTTLFEQVVNDVDAQAVHTAEFKRGVSDGS